MSRVVSANYRELPPEEVERVAEECANSWQDPVIPMRQYEACVKAELADLRNGKPCAPFAALAKCLRKLPIGCTASRPKLLDVGASGGYYSEVLQELGFRCDYQAVDFSTSFKELAMWLYPDIAFDVADAAKLPYADNSFPIVLHGAVLMHSRRYPQLIREAARVASQYVIFHRTPIVLNRPTMYYEKYGYERRMLEIHFNEKDLLQLFDAAGLALLHTECVFWDASAHYGHRSYLLRKQTAGELEWERA